MERTEIMMDIMGMEPFELRILHPAVSLQRQQYENTLFHIRPSISPHGQRILASMENAVVKIEMLTYLPQLCDCVLKGDPDLEQILGPVCLEELVKLIMVQMAWKDSKSGKIPWNESHTSLLMEKSLSDKKTSQPHGIMRGRLMLRRNNTKNMHEQDADSVREQDTTKLRRRSTGVEANEQGKAFEPEMDKTKYGSSSRLQVPTNTTSSGRRALVDRTGFMTKTTISVPVMNIQEEEPHDKSSFSYRQQQQQKLLGTDKKNKNKMITSLFQKDPSKFYFLWDLVIKPEGSRQSEQEKQQQQDEKERTKSYTLTHHDDDHQNKKEHEGGTTTRTDEKKNVNILQLIREALNSKYEDHVRKALNEKDLKSLLCILTLLTDQNPPPSLLLLTGTNTNAQRQSSVSGHYHDPPRAIHSSQHGNRLELPRKTKQKNHCSKCPKHKSLSNLRQKTRTGTNSGKSGTEENTKKSQSNSDHADDDDKYEPIVLSLSENPSISTGSTENTDTDFQNEVWAILQHERELQQEEPNENKPFYQEIFPFYQEDTLDTVDSLNLTSDYVVDEIETELNVLENTEPTEILPENTDNFPSPADKNFPVKLISTESATECSSDEPEKIIVKIARFTAEPTPTVMVRSTLDLTRIQVLSTHEEVKEKSSESKEESSSEAKEKDKTDQSEDVKNFAKPDITKIESSEPGLAEKNICESYWESELRRSYQSVLNLLSSNTRAQEWIECNMKNEDKEEDILPTECTTTTTSGLKSFKYLFEGLCKLAEDRLAASMEESLKRDRRLRDIWTSVRRLTSELCGLQKEMKALEHQHIPYMLTLDFQIRILNSRLRKISKEIFQDIRVVVRDTELSAGVKEKGELINLSRSEEAAEQCGNNRDNLKTHYDKEYEKFKTKRKQMYQVLEETIAHYDEVMNKMQEKLDLTVAESVINERRVKLVQHKFEDVESRYIDMCAEKKLTQIMRNMKMADEKKQHKAAKTIQECWRRYKIRKRKRERRKARRGKKKGQGAPSFGGGKKKTVAKGQDSSPPSQKPKK